MGNDGSDESMPDLGGMVNSITSNKELKEMLTGFKNDLQDSKSPDEIFGKVIKKYQDPEIREKVFKIGGDVQARINSSESN